MKTVLQKRVPNKPQLSSLISKKIYLKVVFCKNDFYVFFKFKKNLDKDDFELEVLFLKEDFHGKKSYLRKTILNQSILQINFKTVILGQKT
jgi:hypothetical protein